MVSKAKATKGSILAIDYLLDDKGKAVELDRYGIAGSNGTEILAEFRSVQAVNSRCGNNTYSIVLSPSNEKNFTLQELREIGRKHLQNLGLDKHQYLMTAHLSTDQPHIHLQVNRIAFSGEAHDDSFISKKAQTSAEKIAKAYGLMTAKEVTKMKQEQTKPIWQEIEQANIFAMKNASTFTQYTEFMRAKGVEVQPTINKKGVMQGFRLLHRESGLNFKASEIPGTGLGHLPKNGVKFDVPVTSTYAEMEVKRKQEQREEQIQHQQERTRRSGLKR